MCVTLVVTALILDIVWHIKDRAEICKLNKQWEDLFNAKLDSESRFGDLCNHYLQKITDLCIENEKLKKELQCSTQHKKKKS